MTIEQLAAWIDDNHVGDLIHHVETTDLTEEETTELEHKSSLASRSIDRLQEVLDLFKGYIKDGTPFNTDKEEYEPISITIPPSKGMKSLKANREAADSRLEKGVNEIDTDIYLIPHPDELMMVAVDIEGTEWPDYTRPMTEDEKEAHGKLFYKGEDGKTKEMKVSKGKKSKDIEEPFI
jgi:hypothetical protein